MVRLAPLGRQVRLVQSRDLPVQLGQLVLLVQLLPLRDLLAPLEQAEQLGQPVLPDLPRLLPVLLDRQAQMVLLDPQALRVQPRRSLVRPVQLEQLEQEQRGQQAQLVQLEVVPIFRSLKRDRK